ncbi:putative nonsense-mediated mRNA decay protein Upf3 [Aspergillus clavatus NRRL 1]|uniref:Nonsense-mediated mRNA decay protein Upf3, putative n=1 Tax=Aspergillus clavatus (strain ATCC 1007 / CBS 513.65 / DSM 816 / NCTC 3887 / NRRL 1 / QM 1276 / 107) TaxID=344612 RepID=A1CU31_ASPCL|nr:nonsense-mediated mRNA decay protein Upf3, putative [Aspergillus clavatus NRRL 1]EAW06818.1 nonsense-mediated mRNA decay protein Upf3, putative [Aspergillus clavatus NRRL 1]
MTQISPGKPTGGVLQIPATATQKNSSSSRKNPKPAAPRLKLLVRRLPPGLTQTEFENALGSEWAIGAGKVDWYQYKPGKIAKDHAKPSRPSRAYIHVTSSEHIASLSDKVRQTPFIDSRNTVNDPVLLGPPSLEFSPYAKIPGSRVRKDARQGTIDQDPEFIAFLESLTQPITKPAPVESAEADEKKETVTTTPLVQYIKEKKASKAKEAASKSSRHAKGDKDSKSEKVQAKRLLQRPDKDTSQASPEKAEKKPRTADKAAKEAVKAANRAANVTVKQTAKPTSQVASRDASQPASQGERRRERGNIAAAAKILQRDLGLAPSGARRRGGKGTPTDTEQKKEAEATTEAGKKDTATRSGKAASPAQPAPAKGRGNAPPQTSEPASSRGQSSPGTPPANAPTAPAKQSKSGRGKQAAAVASSTATQAFLKHANPSQGVTEPLLETAFSPFGKIVKVEIDKKKGFGYIDFTEPGGLQKAIAASPVTVAQSQVVVLERKVNPGAEKGRGKGRSEPPASSAGSTNGNRGKSGGGGEGGSGAATPSSSRGPRGGRGSRNKGGAKGSGGNAGANANASGGKSSETK